MIKLFKKFKNFLDKKELWFVMPFLFVLLILVIIVAIAQSGGDNLPFIYVGF